MASRTHDADLSVIGKVTQTGTPSASGDLVTKGHGDANYIQAASGVAFTPTGTIAATTTQTAIAEVATDAAADLTAHLNDTVDAHDASAISFIPTGSVAATNVQSAIAEVALEAGGGAPVGTKMTDLTALTGADAADTDILEVVDISDTAMAASGTNKKMTLAELRTFLDLPATIFNASVTNQGAGFASDTYLVGSSIAIPAGRLQAKSIYRCRFNVTKTGAGTATPIINIRYGTAGSTADTSRGTLTFSAQTAVADEGMFEVDVVFRTVGSGTSAVIQSTARLTHRLGFGTAGTGLSTVGAEQEVATSGGFDSTVASSIIGISVNGGTSAAWTVNLVTAELTNLS